MFKGEDSKYESLRVSCVRVGKRAWSRVRNFRVFPERDGALQKGTVQWGFASVLVKSRVERVSLTPVPPIQSPPAKSDPRTVPQTRKGKRTRAHDS